MSDAENIYDLLHDLQKQLKAPKNQYSSFGGYHYRSCEDILEAVKPLMPQGASITISDAVVQIGSRYYVRAEATLMYKGAATSAVAFAREPESKKSFDDSQVTGAASSYARKYALNGLLLIDDQKDADAQQQAAPVAAVKAVKKEKPEYIKKAEELYVTMKKLLDEKKFPEFEAAWADSDDFLMQLHENPEAIVPKRGGGTVRIYDKFKDLIATWETKKAEAIQ